MTAWNWSKLLARSADGRGAIYDERFLSRWEELVAALADEGRLEFTEHEATQLLTVFAVSWEHLPESREEANVRFHLVVFDLLGTSDHIGVAFVARALTPDQIVITHAVLGQRL